jgi:hypothetical protein
MRRDLIRSGVAADYKQKPNAFTERIVRNHRGEVKSTFKGWPTRRAILVLSAASGYIQIPTTSTPLVDVSVDIYAVSAGAVEVAIAG